MEFICPTRGHTPYCSRCICHDGWLLQGVSCDCQSAVRFAVGNSIRLSVCGMPEDSVRRASRLDPGVAEVMSRGLQRTRDGWRLPIEQRGVSRCIVDHAFALEFHEGEQSVVVRIEGSFTISHEGRVYRLTPAAPEQLGPAVGLFGRVVRSATASTRGQLVIAFEDGPVLSVEPDARYEAWEMYGADGVRAVCTPGGEIAVWQPDDEPSSA